MKKTLIILVLLFSSSVLAKAYQSIHGFKASIPDNYLIVSLKNVDEVKDKIKTLENFDLNYWETKIISGLTHLNMELLFNTNNLNHIIILSTEAPSYKEFDASLLSSLCPNLIEGYNDSEQRNVDQIDCKISSTPGILGNSIYAKHIGILPEVTTFQYFFYINSEIF